MTAREQFNVPVKTWLDPHVYRQLSELATQRDTTVGVLVAVAARRAVTPRTPVQPSRKNSKMTDERFEWLCKLARTDLTVAQIAEQLGVSRATVYNHIGRARSQS